MTNKPVVKPVFQLWYCCALFSPIRQVFVKLWIQRDLRNIQGYWMHWNLIKSNYYIHFNDSSKPSLVFSRKEWQQKILTKLYTRQPFHWEVIHLLWTTKNFPSLFVHLSIMWLFMEYLTGSDNIDALWRLFNSVNVECRLQTVDCHWE